MSKLEVIQPGMLSQFQDLGRFGAGHLGLSQGGAIDLHAYCWANHLLANNMHATVLEVLLGDATFLAHDNMRLALTGAEMNATLDSIKVKNWSSFVVKKGQILKLGYAQRGLRSYLAIKGGFDSSCFLNSSATVIRNHIGGLAKTGETFGQGNKLLSGDIFSAKVKNASRTLLVSMPPASASFSVAEKYIPDYPDEIVITVMPSYQYNDFSQVAKDTFFNSGYIVTNQSDRMGMRLSGEKIACHCSGIISEGIALGAIQIPIDGQPIILLNDRQTLGGYPKIGCVSRTDLAKLAQAKAGTVIHFQLTDFTTSTQKWIQFSRFFAIQFHID